MERALYDYSDYVELLETNTTREFEPTPNEVFRTAKQYILMDGFPEDFFQLCTSFSNEFIMDMWSYYSVVKRDIVKKCGLRKKNCPFCNSKLTKLKNPKSYSDC